MADQGLAGGLMSRARRGVAQMLPEPLKVRLRRARWAAGRRRRAAHPRVAVVIVAYTGAERLGMCLASVFGKTGYPNLAVVVVDNSGDASVRKLLAEQQRWWPQLKVVLNERNLGFPRAVNLGIAAAGRCDYLVLLNDDTVVTRGWLAGLLRHLEAPGVELVGPVSNWCGNEARIEVAYETMEEMEAFAAAYAERYAGTAWDIRMLAMYCVAMRRELLDRIGLLDERFGIGMFEDDDFSQRVRAAGGRVVCAEDVFVHHWGRASFGAMEEDAYRVLFEENRRKFEEKWGEAWQPHTSRPPGGASSPPAEPRAAVHVGPTAR
jgi:GT2 family glycosyltransferase